jgi:hypothetical protein
MKIGVLRQSQWASIDPPKIPARIPISSHLQAPLITRETMVDFFFLLFILKSLPIGLPFFGTSQAK